DGVPTDKQDAFVRASLSKIGKTPMSEPTTTTSVSPKGAARVRAGHLWIYRSDVIKRPKAATGAVVCVTDQRGRFLAWAHYGAESEITLRLLTTQDVTIDRAFWRARLRAAHEWRARVVSETDAYRLIHAEGDALPGLIVDRYGDCFSLQTLTRGMEVLK